MMPCLRPANGVLILHKSPDASQDIVGEGTISGFEYQTTLATLMNSINVPYGATVTPINSKGDYVPYKKLNYDTVYVDATVSASISLDVVAEDSKTHIIYNLAPTSSESDAFIYSDVYLVTQASNLIEYVPLGVTFTEFLNNVIIPEGATVKLVDKTGTERTIGEIKADDKVVVTSANGEVTNSYYISLLFPNSNTLTYLAYVISETYSVNQLEYTISGTAETSLTDATTVAEFMQRLVPSTGSTLVILDAGGNQKVSGTLSTGDKVKVISGDGTLVVYYDIILGSMSSRGAELSNFVLYPNPTTGLLNISGLNPGNRIQIYNMQGKLISITEAQNYNETISVENVPVGLYLIIISDENRILGRFKAVKR